VRKTLGHIAAVAFLHHGKNNFHDVIIARSPEENKPGI
jgi:hypothetical protein